MTLPSGTRSSQKGARNGLVWTDVGSEALVGLVSLAVLPQNSIQRLVEITRVGLSRPWIFVVNGRVTLAELLSPLSAVKPLISSGLNAINAWSDMAPPERGCTDQPSSGRLSSRILPLQVSG